MKNLNQIESLVEKAFQRMAEESAESAIENTVMEDTVEESSRVEIRKILRRELLGLGPLEILFENSKISEVLVNAHDLIFFEVEGKLQKSDLKFVSPLTYKRALESILKQADKTADSRHPLVDGNLSDGTRVNIVFPPIALKPTVSLRRHVVKTWSLDDLISFGVCSKEQGALLREWIKVGKNIIVAGATSSGKTTLLRALLLEIPDTQRIILMEDTPELGVTKPNFVSMTTRVDPEGVVPDVSLNNLVKNALRMRPDRLVVGEVRGEEALYLLDAMATGHKGSMNSIHAHSALHGIRRLESLVLRGAPQWPLSAIRQVIHDAVDVILFCEKSNGKRILKEAATIAGLEDFGLLLNTEFKNEA